MPDDAAKSVLCGRYDEGFGPCVLETGHDGQHGDASDTRWITHAELDERFAEYIPDLRWYWAIFKDDHVLGGPELKCNIITDWYETLGEAQSRMEHYDRDTHRIHGVLRDANE